MLSSKIPPKMKILNTLSPYYNFPNSVFQNSGILSDALLQYHLKLDQYKPRKAARHPTRCDVINDVSILQNILSQIFSVI